MDLPETRITQSTSSSTDCCYTNLDPELINVNVHKNYAGLSDHHGVVCMLKNSTLHLGLKKKQTRYCRSITTKKLNELQTHLLQQSCSNAYEAETVDDKYK